MVNFPYTTQALRISQPLGTFFVAVLPAQLLLEACFSDQLRAIKPDESGYALDGTQRTVKNDRLRAIADYIDRYDSAFPNSIILAANLREEDGVLEEEESVRWSISKVDECDSYHLSIPTSQKLAAIIDGQHRLFAFRFAVPARLDTPLVCSIFLDLPKPFQAQLFATINSTQKPVDKSLTYELFGYNVTEEPEAYWSPDKLAVFLARKLNTEPESPLTNRIIIAPLNDLSVNEAVTQPSWKISMATVVEGILRLISSNPKRDTNELLTPKRNERSILKKSTSKDHSVLRNEYIDQNDQLIYLVVKNFLVACNELFWKNASDSSFIVKTIGIQAQFDILRLLTPYALKDKDISVNYFSTKLAPAAAIDFAGDNFRNASGSGRTEIRRAIETAIGLT